jgi:hypothetical protein
MGDLNANIGLEEIFQRITGRWSSHEVSNSNGQKATYFPAKKIHAEIW